MIKNMLILLLTASVAGLSWLTLANTQEKTEMQAGFQAKFEQLKEQMSKAYQVAKQEKNKQRSTPDGVANLSSPLSNTPGKKITIENFPAQDEPIRQSADNTSNESSVNQSATEVLTDITKEKEKHLSALSDSEFSSIQSTLRSALKILNKSSVPSLPEKEATPPKVDTVEIERVKKKSDTGLEELVSMSTSL